MDSLSQRRISSATVTLDNQSLAELNDNFAGLCWDTAYKEIRSLHLLKLRMESKFQSFQFFQCVELFAALEEKRHRTRFYTVLVVERPR